MNNIINSSGVYDITSYNLTSNKTTILSTFNVSGLTQLNSTTITSSLNVSGLTQLNSTTITSSLNVSGSTYLNKMTMNNSLYVSGITILNNDTTIISSLNVSGITMLNNDATINSSLYINTSITDFYKAALSVNSSSLGILVNIKQNAVWVDNNNYALNVDGYSNFGGIQINGQNSNNIYKRIGDLSIVSPDTSSILLKTNNGYWETMRLNPYGVTINTLLYVTGLTTFNNAVTCSSSLNVSGFTTLNRTTCLSSLNVSGATTIKNNLTCSSLNVSGDSNLGPTFINNFTGPNNTFCLMGTTGNILNINASTFSRLGTSEDPKDTHILMYSGGGAYYRANYNTGGTTFHMFGDTTSNNYLKLEPSINTSYNPLIVTGNTTMNSNLNILGNVYAANLPNVSTFTIYITKSVLINSTTHYKYDLDLRQYTTSNITFPFISVRKFKFMCTLASGAHNLGVYSLNYDIDYSDVNYPSTGPQQSLAQYNGINCLAVGFPYDNLKLNQITSNGLFLIKKNFNYITIVSRNQVALLCVIIDYFT